MVPSGAPKIVHFHCKFYARRQLLLRLAGAAFSVPPLPFIFLSIATQSVRFVFPSALSSHSTFSLLLFSYLFLFSKPLFVTGRSVCEAAISILEEMFQQKISYMAIRNNPSHV